MRHKLVDILVIELLTIVCGGRNISCDSTAQASVRVMGTAFATPPAMATVVFAIGSGWTTTGSVAKYGFTLMFISAFVAAFVGYLIAAALMQLLRYNNGVELVMMTLEQAREEINAADREMAVLFERRMKAIEPIIAYKMANNLPIFDSVRETQVRENNSKLIKEEALVGYYKEFISTVMDISKKYQRSIVDKAAK